MSNSDTKSDRIAKMGKSELRTKLRAALEAVSFKSKQVVDLQYEVNTLEFDKARYFKWYNDLSDKIRKRGKLTIEDKKP